MLDKLVITYFAIGAAVGSWLYYQVRKVDKSWTMLAAVCWMVVWPVPLVVWIVGRCAARREEKNDLASKE
jgi:hypothetical protein